MPRNERKGSYDNVGIQWYLNHSSKIQGLVQQKYALVTLYFCQKTSWIFNKTNTVSAKIFLNYPSI